MSVEKTGGPAFPILERGGNGLELTWGGMTLRDYFAANAVQGLLAGILSDGTTVAKGDAERLAQFSYRVADAMLEVRKP